MKRVIFFSLLIFCVASVFAQSTDLQPLATINITKTESITLMQLKQRVESYKLQTGLTSFTVDQKKEILDGMINEKLIVQAAQKSGISLTDAQVNEFFLDNMQKQLGQPLTEAQLSQLVKEQTGLSLDEYIQNQVGMNLKEYKSYLKNQLIAQQYILNTKKDEIMAASMPTDEEIRSYYELKKSAFFQSDILKLFLVIVPKNNDEKAARKKATTLLEELKSNKTSPDKLKILQQTDNSFQAGDIFISKTEQAAMQLGINYKGLMELFTKNVGHFSELSSTATDFQFYIIRDKYDAKLLTLSDVIQPDSTTTVYEFIKLNLAQQKQAQNMSKAVEDVTKNLRVAENYKMLKSGSALDKLLENW